MKKTFSYHSKASLKDNLTEILVGIALIVVPIVYPFGIRIGATRVLGPLPTTIILGLVGIYFLVKVFRKVRKANALAAQNCVITVEDEKITYPVLKKGVATESSFSKTDISETDYDEDDGMLTVKLNNGDKIMFDVEFFETIDHLKEFANLIRN